jgi:hypothetical protein
LYLLLFFFPNINLILLAIIVSISGLNTAIQKQKYKSVERVIQLFISYEGYLKLNRTNKLKAKKTTGVARVIMIIITKKDLKAKNY